MHVHCAGKKKSGSRIGIGIGIGVGIGIVYRRAPPSFPADQTTRTNLLRELLAAVLVT